MKPILLMIFLLSNVFIGLSAQENEPLDTISIEPNPDAYRISLLTSSPRLYRAGFVQRYESDTLWLSAGISGRPALAIAPYTADQIVNIQLPDGIKTKSRFLSGALLGFGIGLGIGGTVALVTDCSDRPGFSATGCAAGRLAFLTVSPISGMLIGGLIGAFSNKSVVKYSTVSIEGRPEALRAQRQRLEELTRWQQ
ncbi:MAG: hypothetical protein AAFY36_00155 [Bacteroidota bacterium]